MSYAEGPAYTNAEGVKWWRDSFTQRYAESRGLIGVAAWLIRRPDGYMARVLTEGGAVIADDQTLDGIGSKIDALSISRKWAQQEREAG